MLELLKFEMPGVTSVSLDEVVHMIISSNEDKKISIFSFVSELETMYRIHPRYHFENDIREYGWAGAELYRCMNYSIERTTSGANLFLPKPELLTTINVKAEPIKVEEAFIIDSNDKNGNKSKHDIISNPSHYTKGRKYEPRKVIADWRLDFNLGNAVKYIARAGRKGDKIEDLKKAIQYIEFEIEESEEDKNE